MPREQGAENEAGAEASICGTGGSVDGHVAIEAESAHDAEFPSLSGGQEGEGGGIAAEALTARNYSGRVRRCRGAMPNPSRGRFKRRRILGILTS